MKNIFTDHPHAEGMTYWQHFKRTLHFGKNSAGLTVIILTHGLFPFLFKRTFSNRIKKIAKELEQNKV